MMETNIPTPNNNAVEVNSMPTTMTLKIGVDNDEALSKVLRPGALVLEQFPFYDVFYHVPYLMSCGHAHLNVDFGSQAIIDLDYSKPITEGCWTWREGFAPTDLENPDKPIDVPDDVLDWVRELWANAITPELPYTE